MNIELTKKQMWIGVIHLVLFVVSLGITVSLASLIWKHATIFMSVELGFFIILVISLLDYFDLITVRKTVRRKTKCAICERVSESEYEHEKLIKLISFSESKGDTETESEEKITTTEKIPDRPLEGIVVSDKVICSDCIKRIKKFG